MPALRAASGSARPAPLRKSAPASATWRCPTSAKKRHPTSSPSSALHTSVIRLQKNRARPRPAQCLLQHSRFTLARTAAWNCPRPPPWRAAPPASATTPTPGAGAWCGRWPRPLSPTPTLSSASPRLSGAGCSWRPTTFRATFWMYARTRARAAASGSPTLAPCVRRARPTSRARRSVKSSRVRAARALRPGPATHQSKSRPRPPLYPNKRRARRARCGTAARACAPTTTAGRCRAPTSPAGLRACGGGKVCCRAPRTLAVCRVLKRCAAPTWRRGSTHTITCSWSIAWSTAQHPRCWLLVKASRGNSPG